MNDPLDDGVDSYLGNYLKNWAARQAVPFHSKQEILRAAKLERAQPIKNTTERIFFWRASGVAGRQGGVNPFAVQFSQVGIWTPRMLNVMRLLA